MTQVSDMNRESRLTQMMANYSKKREQLGQEYTLEFHRRHLALFMGRFLQFVGFYRTPTSALLSHDLFLVVEAATRVAKADWTKLNDRTAPAFEALGDYFEGFDRMRSGAVSLSEGALECVDALKRE